VASGEDSIAEVVELKPPPVDPVVAEAARALAIAVRTLSGMSHASLFQGKNPDHVDQYLHDRHQGQGWQAQDTERPGGAASLGPGC
jgi:hypothetical protein